MKDLSKQYLVSQIVDDFISSKIIENLSSRTIKHYRENLGYFFKFKQHEYINDYSKQDISNYILYMKSLGISDNTINTRLRTIKVLFKFASAEYAIELPTIKLLKVDRKVKDTHSTNELKKLLEIPNKNNFTAYRNWVMINFFIGTGARLSSVANVKIQDIDFSTNSITFNTSKNRESYRIPLAKHLGDILAEYIQILPIGTEFLFTKKNGTQLTNIAIQQSLRKYAKSKGLDTNLSGIHCYRRDFATTYASASHDYMRLQRLLNHKDSTMSQYYVRITNEDLQSGFDDYSIFNKLN